VVGTEPVVGREVVGTELVESLADGRQRGVQWVAAVGREAAEGREVDGRRCPRSQMGDDARRRGGSGTTLVAASGGVERLCSVGTSGDDAGQEQAGNSIWRMNGDSLELTDGSRQ
jgi:hypothetical protein